MMQVFAVEWRDILGNVWIKFWRDRISTVAGAATFYALLALFPAIASFVSLYGLFADVHTVNEHLAWLRGLLPSRGLDVIGQEMVRIATAQDTKLGLAFAVSLLVSLWSAGAAVMAIIEGLNAAYEENETRSYGRVTLISLAFAVAMLVLALALSAFAALAVFSPAIPGALAGVLEVVRWIVLLGLSTLFVLALYAYGPSGRRQGWYAIVPGALVAIAIWLAASALFSIYVSDFANYERVYGSLGAIVGFLVWIWISLLVVLFGGELNAQIERRMAPESQKR